MIDSPEHLLYLERFEGAEVPIPSRWLGARGQEGPVYQLRRGDHVLWTVGVDFGYASSFPFREQRVWAAAGVVVIGGGEVVYVLDAATGELRHEISVEGYFGHFKLARVAAPAGGEEELLFVLGCRDVHAIDARLATRWVARDVAIDGIVFVELRDNAVIVSAEMDPPGGWVDVALDVVTGALLRREDPG